MDASEACNILSFQLSGDVKRSWEIKVRTELVVIFPSKNPYQFKILSSSGLGSKGQLNMSIPTKIGLPG